MSEDINLYRVIKGMNKDKKDFCHKDISARHLYMIIKRYEKQHEQKRDNFRSLLFYDLMQTYIHLANNDENKEYLDAYSLNKVLLLAKEWKRIHKTDEDAHFYLAVLELINAFQTRDEDKKTEGFRNAKNGFEKCIDIYKKKYNKIGMPRRWLKKEFLLGKELGLRGLVIFDFNIDISMLHTFTGEIEDNQGQLFVQYKGLLLKYLPTFAYDRDSEVRETERGQRRPFQYRFCISRKNLLMFKFRKV
jgi:hypothetical protein